jgi:periplasmic protein TonB
MPNYNGGEYALLKFLSENAQYPRKARRNFISGVVFVQFIVDTNGKPNNFKIIRSVHPLLDAEALRVMQQMSNWEPGYFEGEKTKVYYTIPMKFIIR